MNNVMLIGRLTKDPMYRYDEVRSIASFILAINRGKTKDGDDKGADFPKVVVFGRQAVFAKKIINTDGIKEVVPELKRIVNNLNQIANVYCSGK